MKTMPGGSIDGAVDGPSTGLSLTTALADLSQALEQGLLEKEQFDKARLTLLQTFVDMNAPASLKQQPEGGNTQAGTSVPSKAPGGNAADNPVEGLVGQLMSQLCDAAGEAVSDAEAADLDLDIKTIVNSVEVARLEAFVEDGEGEALSPDRDNDRSILDLAAELDLQVCATLGSSSSNLYEVAH
jgi:hypothetical protein